MSDRLRAKLMVERWSSSLSREDRKHSKMPGLFDSLCEDMFHAGIDFDAAYDAMKEAAKNYYPKAEVVKNTFANMKFKNKTTVQDFAKSWHETIDKGALEAFYTYYKIEGTTSKQNNKPAKSIGMTTDDELNEQDFWKSVKSVSKDNPWVFGDNDGE